MMPEQTVSLTNLAQQEAKYLGYALLLIGIVEALIIPRTLFKNNERK